MNGLVQLVLYGWSESDQTGIEYTFHHEKKYTPEYIGKLLESRAIRNSDNVKALDALNDFKSEKRDNYKVYYRDICICITKEFDKFDTFWIIIDGKSYYCDYFMNDKSNIIRELMKKYEIERITTHWTNIEIYNRRFKL